MEIIYISYNIDNESHSLDPKKIINEECKCHPEHFHVHARDFKT